MWWTTLIIFTFLPYIFPYRLIFDLPSRSAAELPDDLPPDDDEIEGGYLGMPGFITQYGACVQPPPECPNENITFWFYTKSTQHAPVQVDMSSPENVKKLKPVPGKPWKLLIHGYTGWKDYAPNTEVRPAYFKHGEYNIVSVDYSPISQSPCYWSAAHNVPLVSNCTAQFIDSLVSQKLIKLPELHVVAFSLGAQVAGYLSQFLKSGKLRRITGLDPALPLFMTPNTDKKLDSSDAEFVDVIHTNAAYKGQLETTGHIDFYPNGGYKQVGCSSAEYGSVSSCNHARAVKYFAESISTKVGFWGVPCGSLPAYSWGWCTIDESTEVIMGENTPDSATGTYYLTTGGHEPFALGKTQQNETSSRKG